MRGMRAHLIAALIVAASIGAAASSGGVTQSNSPPPKCDAPEHRQFDFWLGDWDVADPQGRIVGHNVIARELDSCVIHERWTGAGSTQGESFNVWDRERRRWHQTWVDNHGALLLLDGSFANGSMRLTGESGPRDRPATNRITWTPMAGGRVRQLWEVSTDRGQTWAVSFDGTYRPQKSY
jgi:hypothetical protein